ncbi:ABC-2 type transport system ATP-binding protein [Aliiruegeria haliotis]|uniref:ABC-2 type transport system ATP-binding protein n=1 Tax=Aliiruegeria haliotis TaxID=1280846 RepID=A0A2T0RN37_9RHOB|nr:ATP-binding cassette domain-containing protein [Aliiruegeria haliotis]PRY22523.1 ABC-2 type transport system ATP-binding protein [Aliiruegeria haliotis]
MSLVSAQKLSKRFGEMIAVDNVSLDVARGEVVGFLGPNGAGKSTTMKMISGFLEPDRGAAEICGVDVWSHPEEAKSRLGYLPEGAPAYGDMPVADFLRFCGRMRGLKGAGLRNRLAEMADRVRLTEVWSRPIETLSKGYRRRVGIAQALIHDPDVLILDEPTDGLDPNQKHEMRTLIRTIAPEKSIIVSTHILEEVEAICSRAVIIARGQVVADSTPQDLLERAANGRAIRVTIGSPEEKAVVEKVKPCSDGADLEVMERRNGSTRLLLRYGDTPADATELAKRLRDAELPVEEVGLWRPRLEDVFRDVTTPYH